MAKTVIVGGVAAGMSTATRLRRLDESAQIVVLEAGSHVSFANCGLPYYVGGVIEERDSLLLQTPQSLAARFGLDVRVNTRALSIDPHARTVLICAPDGSQYTEHYDSLVLAPGARPAVPMVSGAERALTLRDIADVDRLSHAIEAASTAVILGAGFVGLELAENLVRKGLQVTVVELAPQVLGALDAELAVRIHDALTGAGVAVHTGARVDSISATHANIVTADGQALSVPADVVIAAIGVRPDSQLAVHAGVEVNSAGAIVTDGAGRTSVPGIFAAGDVAAKTDAVSGSERSIPLANLANREGRRVADAIAGREPSPRASMGTAIVSVFGVVAAIVGANERILAQSGRSLRVIHSHPLDHAGYYPGATQMALKLIVDADTDQILGAQAVGGAGVDKRIDVIATAMAGGLRASDLADLELAYAPEFGSAKDPVNMLGYIAQNALSGLSPTVQWHELSALEPAAIIDVRSPQEHARGTVDGSVNIPLDELRSRHTELPEQGRIVVHCQVGQRGHSATRLLRQLGYDAVNLDGGWLTYRDGLRSTIASRAS